MSRIELAIAVAKLFVITVGPSNIILKTEDKDQMFIGIALAMVLNDSFKADFTSTVLDLRLNTGQQEHKHKT